MLRKWMLVIWLVFAALPASAERVSALTDTIIRLADQEPIPSAIDTRFRLAEALIPSNPRVSHKLLSEAVDLLKAHSEALRTYGMASSLLSLDPTEAEKLLLAGPDRVNGYKLILRYERSLFETTKMAETFRRALRDSTATPRIGVFHLVRPVLTHRGALGEEDAKDGAKLFLELADAGRGSAFEAELAGLFDELLTSFANVLPARAPGVRAALISLLPLVTRPDFAADATLAYRPAKFSIGNQTVETRSARDTILFRFGTLLHSLDPQAFQKAGDLFSAWHDFIAPVTSPEQAARVIRLIAAPRQSIIDALSAAERLPGVAGANAYAAIAARRDSSPDQRVGAMTRSLDKIASVSSADDALLSAGNLLEVARRWHPDAALSRRLLSEYLNLVRRAGQNPDDYFTLAAAEQDLGQTLDSGEDAILTAKRAVARLQKVPAIQPVANFHKGYSLRGDGRGPYPSGEEHTVIAAHTYALGICTEVDKCSTVPETAQHPRQANRALLFDLNAPVPGSGAVPRGVIRSTEASFSAFSGVDPTQPRVWAGLERVGVKRIRDISVGKTGASDRTEIRFFIDSAQHILQFGPFTTGLFQTTAQVPLHGEGTTRASVTRQSSSSWLIRSGSRGIGRLWDNRDPAHPVDLGLYYFSFEVQIAQLPVR